MTLMNPPSARLLFLSAIGLLASCSTQVEQPKGTSNGYHSARLIQRDPNGPAITDAKEKQAYALVQNAIAKQFTSHGLSYGGRSTDLAVAFLVIYQEPGMTSTYPAYFGYGRESGEISDLAHTRGALENKRPDFFRQAGVVVDVVDNKTNKLVYRGFAKDDVIQGASTSTRAARIDAAVDKALDGFFK